jgi:hypothetical protein
LRAFENSAMEKWRQLYNRSFRIVSKMGGMRWTGYAARLKWARNVYNILAGDRGIDVGIILN